MARAYARAQCCPVRPGGRDPARWTGETGLGPGKPTPGAVVDGVAGSAVGTMIGTFLALSARSPWEGSGEGEGGERALADPAWASFRLAGSTGFPRASAASKRQARVVGRRWRRPGCALARAGPALFAFSDPGLNGRWGEHRRVCAPAL